MYDVSSGFIVARGDDLYYITQKKSKKGGKSYISLTCYYNCEKDNITCRDLQKNLILIRGIIVNNIQTIPLIQTTTKKDTDAISYVKMVGIRTGIEMIKQKIDVIVCYFNHIVVFKSKCSGNKH